MNAPVVARDDVIALSFVSGLPHASLYPLLRKETPPSEGVLPFGEESASTPAGTPPASGHQLDPLESLIARVQQANDGRRLFDRRDPRALAAHGRREAAAALTKAAALGVDIIVWGDARYPPLLSHIFDPPLVLWLRGSAAVLSMPAIAIVGSRAASAYGEDTAARLARDIAASGLVVVSGLARGIDAAAHRGALERGQTMAVLGCGPDVVYPPEHRTLVDEVAARGAVISEYGPGAKPLAYRFPHRNRIISGLSRGVVVVEAWRKSGALITANCALEQGREVMAVPGSILGERHRGSHMLIKCGAALVETAADVLDALQLAHGAVPQARLEHPDPVVAALDEAEGCDLDELVVRLGSNVATLLPRLLELELMGRIRRVPGGRFVRSSRTC